MVASVVGPVPVKGPGSVKKGPLQKVTVPYTEVVAELPWKAATALKDNAEIVPPPTLVLVQPFCAVVYGLDSTVVVSSFFTRGVIGSFCTCSRSRWTFRTSPRRMSSSSHSRTAKTQEGQARLGEMTQRGART